MGSYVPPRFARGERNYTRRRLGCGAAQIQRDKCARREQVHRKKIGAQGERNYIWELCFRNGSGTCFTGSLDLQRRVTPTVA